MCSFQIADIQDSEVNMAPFICNIVRGSSLVFERHLKYNTTQISYNILLPVVLLGHLSALFSSVEFSTVFKSSE